MDATRRRFLLGTAAVACCAVLPAMPAQSPAFIGWDLAKPGGDFTGFMKVWHDGTTLHVDSIEWHEVYADIKSE